MRLEGLNHYCASPRLEPAASNFNYIILYYIYAILLNAPAGAHRRPLLEFGLWGVLSDSQLSVVAPGRAAGTEASSFSDSSRLFDIRSFVASYAATHENIGGHRAK